MNLVGYLRQCTGRLSEQTTRIRRLSGKAIAEAVDVLTSVKSDILAVYLRVMRTMVGLHAVGLSHRDLEARNILLTRRPSPRIVDWTFGGRTITVTEHFDVSVADFGLALLHTREGLCLAQPFPIDPPAGHPLRIEDFDTMPMQWLDVVMFVHTLAQADGLLTELHRLEVWIKTEIMIVDKSEETLAKYGHTSGFASRRIVSPSDMILNSSSSSTSFYSIPSILPPLYPDRPAPAAAAGGGTKVEGKGERRKNKKRHSNVCTHTHTRRERERER